jgi:hypothetical protein
MGYPRLHDLDEVPEAELQAELVRRQQLRDAGLCDYCELPTSTPSCRFEERHNLGVSRDGKVQKSDS